MNCDECAHYFKPLFKCISIQEVREALFQATSPTVWVVWHGQRYPVENFAKVNYTWSLWARKRLNSWAHPMALTDMLGELKKRENWEGLHNYGLKVNIVPDKSESVWAGVLRIEDTRTMSILEDDTETENITGEVLIYVHTEEDVRLGWEASQRQ